MIEMKSAGAVFEFDGNERGAGPGLGAVARLNFIETRKSGNNVPFFFEERNLLWPARELARGKTDEADGFSVFDAFDDIANAVPAAHHLPANFVKLEAVIFCFFKSF